MKKLISIFLSMSMIVSMTTTAFAAEPISAARTQDGIIGEIIYEDTITVNADDRSVLSDSANELNTIVSAEYASDGSVTIYEYTNDELTQYHTTMPGSGVLDSTYLNEDGTTRTERTITKEKSNGDTPTTLADNYTSNYSNIGSPTSVRPLGYMHYRNTWTDTIFSINCEVIERYHPNEDFTFNEKTGGDISFWVGSVVSVLMLTAAPGTFLAKKIVQGLITAGLIALGAGTTYFGVGSHTVRCNWYEQEIHGTPTAPSGRGSQKYLSGIYAYVDYGKGPVVETEGYTVKDWGYSSLGRWMMYSVFGIDESPTSWTGVDRSLAPAQ